MCAVVGVINSPKASFIAYYALFAMQHRGQESSGLSVSDGSCLRTHKAKGELGSIFTPQILERLKGSLAIGHNRYSTAGKSSLKDAQPVAASCSIGDISLVHNGNLTNKDQLRTKLINSGAIFHSNMDSENIIHIIARSKARSLKQRFIQAIKSSTGAFCFILASKDELFVARDAFGIRPLSLGRLEDGGYIVASESCAFDLVGAKFIKDIAPGELLCIKSGSSSYESTQLLAPKPARICAFEYIYFARPDSIIEGKSVYEVRKRLGEAIAADFKEKIDFVVPVPDSGVSAALGFARSLGVDMELAIVRSHYIGRTFIEPCSELRDLKVKLKLSPIKAELKGKSIAVLDDSIVRGTTSKKIVALLRAAGADKIHFVVAAPKICYPDRYGIDTPTKAELISARMDTKELCEYIGANSLYFLSIDKLKQALGDEREYSLVSFDGDYFAS